MPIAPSSEAAARLSRRLALALPAAAVAASAPPASRTEIEPLLELVRLGYYKGIVQWLDDWVQRRPEQAAFAQGLRTLAREFRFETIEQQLLQGHDVAPG